MPNYSNKVIYSDFIGVDAWPGRGRFQRQISNPHRSRGYNRLFGDGSVLGGRAEYGQCHPSGQQLGVLARDH